MKKLALLGIVALIGLGAANSTVLAKDKDKPNEAKAGSAFDMTGTVKKHEMGFCMQAGLKYELHPSQGDMVLLSDGHRQDLKVLEDASHNGKPVHVEGKWESGVECRFVKVMKASPVEQATKH